MRLLIFTQAIDKKDPILGFFHRWVEEFSKHFEHIHVVCLREGVHELPSNVSVYSLRKERGENRLKYIVRFFGLLVHLRGSYDRVFSHMNPHYILLGGLYWKIVGIPVFFWRNHAKMNLMTEIAARFARKVFYTSPFACTSKYAHAYQMPVGIDHHYFSKKEGKVTGKHKILFLGRISPVKRVELFIKAGAILGDEFEFDIYGDAPKKDTEYKKELHMNVPKHVFFHEGVANDETPTIYSAHDVYVNLTPEGSMDKTVLEAVACEVPVVITNPSFLDTVGHESLLEDATPEALSGKIREMVARTPEERSVCTKEAREKLIELHSLEKLGILIHNHLV